MVDVDEGRALEEDALAVGLTTIRGGWVLVDDVMAAVDEATAADELGAALLDADAGFFDVEVEAAFLVVVDSGFLEVDSDFLVVVSAFSNFWDSALLSTSQTNGVASVESAAMSAIVVEISNGQLILVLCVRERKRRRNEGEFDIY